MKRCPTCNRTYADESISFCLADGTLLSAPYDSPGAEAPPTEVLNSPWGEVPPTQPARPATLTMTSRPAAHKDEATGIDSAERKRSSLGWVAMVLALGMIGVAVLTVRFFLKRQNETIASLPAQASPVASPAQSPPAQASPIQAATNPSSSPLAVLTKPTPQPSTEAKVIPSPAKSPAENIGQATLDADPVLFPPAPTPCGPGQSPEYNRIFSGREVDSKARLLSKPEPTYTEKARQNQISGTVVLRAVLSANGQVTNIYAVSGLPDGLTERAIEAAKQIKFVPATKGCHPVSMWMELQYNFNLY
jgi:TonB family protein